MYDHCVEYVAIQITWPNQIQIRPVIIFALVTLLVALSYKELSSCCSSIIVFVMSFKTIYHTQYKLTILCLLFWLVRWTFNAAAVKLF